MHWENNRGNNEICMGKGWVVPEETFSNEIPLELILGNPPAGEKVEEVGFLLEGPA